MQSDGQSPDNRDDQIDLHVPAGTDYLEVENLGGTGAYTLTTSLMPSTSPFQPIPLPRGPSHTPSWRGTSTATAAPTWPSPTRLQRRVGVAGQRRRHLPEPGAVRGGDRASRPRGGGLQRRRPHRPGRRQLRDSNDVSVLLGNGDGTFQDQVTVRGGDRPSRPRGGGLQRRRPHRPGRRQLSTELRTTCRCCWATATAPSRTRCTYAAGDAPDRPRGGGLQRRRPHRPGRRQLRLQRRVGVAGPQRDVRCPRPVRNQPPRHPSRDGPERQRR